MFGFMLTVFPYTILALLIAFVLDLIIGDPHTGIHPMIWIGKFIGFCEGWIRKHFADSKKERFGQGILLVIMVTAVATLIPMLLLILLYMFIPVLAMFVEAVLMYFCLATKSLKTESEKVKTALETQGLEAGRAAVSMIVGRDVEKLDEKGVVRATVETIAENTSDGVIAPIFYMLIGGATLGYFYKAVNTMDSMIGYKNDEYLYFGRAAAKLDDVLNFLPSRIAALFMILATHFCCLTDKVFNGEKAFKIFKRDRYNHASPNSAQTESVMAGALGLKLAGDAWYFGKLYQKKSIGDEDREIEVKDIDRANKLLYWTAFMSISLGLIIKLMIFTEIAKSVIVPSIFFMLFR